MQAKTRFPLIVTAILLVLLAAQPAQSHGEGGIPGQLDDMEAQAAAHDTSNVAAHVALGVDHDALAADHVVLAAGITGLAADHDVQDTAHAGQDSDHFAQSVAHGTLVTDVAALKERLDYLDVDSESGTAPVGGLPTTPGNAAVVLVHVSYAGEGVTGIPETQFLLNTRYVPAGECALMISEFHEFASGDYGLKVRPVESSSSCDWAAGDYISSLTVIHGQRLGTDVLKVTVTPSPSSSEASQDMQTAQSSISLLRG